MEQDLIRERYDLSMARIQEILTEETVPENYRDYFRKGVIILCHDVIHLILIICVQQAIGCKVLWALQHDCPPFNPQEITFVQSHSE